MLYKKIDSTSASSITSALDLFSTPPTSTAVSNSSYREYLTLNPLTTKPFHFKIHPIVSYIDLSKCYLQTEFRIKEKAADGTLSNIDDQLSVGPIQYPGATFIKNLVIHVNGRELFNANQLYSYKAYLDAELSFPQHVKDSQLSVAGYHRDTTRPSDTGNGNTGFKARATMFKGSKTVQFITNIDADLFNQELYLMSNVEIDIEITPQTDDFMILQKAAAAGQTDRNYVLEITDCRLYVKTLELMDGLSLEMARKLDTQPARYSMRKTMLKSFFITDGRQEYNTNIFTDEVPRRVIVGLLDHDAYMGNKKKSPFEFYHFNVRQIQIICSGRTYPQSYYNLDYGNALYARAYHDMQENLGFAFSNESNGISYKNFERGWNLYVFNLTNSMENEPGFELIKDGTTSINIKFAANTPTGGISMIVYGEVDSLLMIDRNRQITSDITV